MTNVNRILDLCNEFLEIPSSINYEKPFLNYLAKKANKLGYNISKKDDYLIIKPIINNNNSKHLFSIHIDRHAMIKNENEKIEYLAFYLKRKHNFNFKRDNMQDGEKNIVKQLKTDKYITNLGDKYFNIEKNNIKTRFIREDGPDFYELIANRHVGNTIYSYDNSGKKIKEHIILRCDSNYKTNLITFDILNKIKKEEKIFSIKNKITKKKDYFFGQIDNVISVAVIFYLLETTNFQDEIIFTTKEEISQSYKCVLDYCKNSTNKKLIILDTSPFEKLEEYPKGFLVLRKGDEMGRFDIKLTNEILNYFIKNNIPYIFKPSNIGKTELGKIIYKTQGKINGTTIQIPTKNYHTTYETSFIENLQNYIKIIKKVSNYQQLKTKDY
ncbi:MAG: hypothetical protein ACOC16_00025 [Nanoarchaeota archaeon]